MCQTAVISHHIGRIGRRSFDRRMRMASPLFTLFAFSSTKVNENLTFGMRWPGS